MKYRLGLILLALAFIISGCGAKKSQELPPLQPGWEQITSAGKVVIALPEGAYDAESIENSHEDGFDIEVQIFDSAPTDWELPMIGVVEVDPPFWYGWAFRLFDDWGNQEVRGHYQFSARYGHQPTDHALRRYSRELAHWAERLLRRHRLGKPRLCRADRPLWRHDAPQGR